MAKKAGPDPAPDTTQRAPDDLEASEPNPGKVDRVHEIRRRMASGHWVTGITGPKLAKKWGVCEQAVRRDAAEASRRNREDLFDREELQTLLVTQLQTLGSRSIKDKRYRDAIEAIKAIAGITGLQSHRLEIEIEADLEAKLADLARSLPPEQFQIAAAILAGKSGGALPHGEGAEPEPDSDP